MNQDESHHERLAELLAVSQHRELSPDEQIELDELIVELGEFGPHDILGELLVMLDEQSQNQEDLPDKLAESIAQSGRAAVASQHPESVSTLPMNATHSRRPSGLWWLSGTAALIAIASGIFAFSVLNAKRANETQYLERLASLREQVNENAQLLERSRIAAAEATAEVNSLDSQLSNVQAELAASAADKLDLAQRLADATMNLENAQLRIAKFEQPEDPAVLAERRRQLLEVPDSIQIAWQPFDLPDAPAEQRTVQGDVVWSDELQLGYIRFVGLEPNDPNVEQYQVWVIDERGLEQKVSGGVFNASADGEVIVPIEPGIDVGRVALFAITVENPGGTWVPDLERRVVVAPRES